MTTLFLIFHIQYINISIGSSFKVYPDNCGSRPYVIWPLDYLSYLIFLHTLFWMWCFIFTFSLFLPHTKHSPLSSSVLILSTCYYLSQIHARLISSPTSGLSPNGPLDSTLLTMLLRIISSPNLTLYPLFMLKFKALNHYFMYVYYLLIVFFPPLE